ncbi:hypothetical protein CYMTET_51538 [Cymbomonas tetramitiformis]|uniref:RING-type domain-containing protein n=1 Tax=Cymbomonas tetramitiformis TaxID=36881 RepID=A0AAE0BKV3_9CHLO|nr:hypothetical protein CYMTET_51538 [Cymbomonas tetramitiformis]
MLIDLASIEKETRCPICLEIPKATKLVKKCMHRFCGACIDKALRQTGDNKCPLCCMHLPSRRETVQDPTFDALLQALYGSVDDFETAEAERLKLETNRYIVVCFMSLS